METCASGGQWPGQHQGKCHQTCWSPHSSRQPAARLSNCTKYLYISVVTGQPQPSPAYLYCVWRGIHCANTGSSAALLPSHRDQCGYSAECVDRAEQWSGVASVTLRCSVLGPSPQVPVPAASSSPAPVHTSNQFCGEMVWACCRAPAQHLTTQQLSTRRHSDTATSQAHVMCFI